MSELVPSRWTVRIGVTRGVGSGVGVMVNTMGVVKMSGEGKGLSIRVIGCLSGLALHLFDSDEVLDFGQALIEKNEHFRLCNQRYTIRR
jgi:hypothetical protein